MSSRHSEDKTFVTREGEQITEKKTVVIPVQPGDEFFMVFLKNLASLYEIGNATQIHVLAALCAQVQFNTNTVALSTFQRRQICEELSISQQTLSNCLRELKKSGLITGEDGFFTVNPDIIWKGSTKERDKLLQSEAGIQLMIKFKKP